MGNPETTRGKYSNATSTFRFPLDVNPSAYTSITFYKYERSISGSPQHIPVSNIQLPLPSTVTDATSLKISEFDMGMMKLILDMAQKGGSLSVRAIEEGLKKTVDASTYRKISSNVKALLNDREKMKSLMAMMPMFGDSNIYQSISGVIRNPHTTSTFQGVVLKPFSFQWKMSPRSQKEAEELRKIDEHIKNRILPEISEGNPYTLDYPHVVKVSFPGTAGFPETNFAFVDTYQFDIPQIALFADGSPIVVQMNLSLKELDIRVSENR